jgi:hypothetical protein
VNVGFRRALFLSSLGVVFAITSANSQETPSNNDEVPSAPSAVEATTCTRNNGKPCPEWVHKLIGQYPPSPESGNFQSQRDPSTVHFWTYRGVDEPPLRTNKQVFRSKLFLAAHIGGAIAMIVACRRKNSGEDWGSEVPAVAGIFGLDYIQFRFIGGPNAIGPPIYEMIHYGLASAK